MHVYLFSLAGLLYILSISWPSFMGMWVCMEAAKLMILAGFFTSAVFVKRYSGLLGLILVSGVSSGLLFTGFMSDSYSWFFLMSLFLKLGMFPFVSWVLVTLVNSPWGVFYMISSVSKISLIYFSGYLSSLDSSAMYLSFLLSFLLLSNILLCGLVNLKMFLALSGVSTGSILIIFLSSLGVGTSLLFLGVYMCYSLVFMGCLSWINVGLLKTKKVILTVFSVLGVPFSFGMLYKLLGSYYIVCFSTPIVAMWAFYSCIEFIYLAVLIFEKSSVIEVW